MFRSANDFRKVDKEYCGGIYHSLKMEIGYKDEFSINLLALLEKFEIQINLIKDLDNFDKLFTCVF